MPYKPQQSQQLEVVIEVDLEGNFDLDVLNGDGKNCTEFTAPIEEALGLTSKRTMKPEADRGHQVLRKQQRVGG